MAKTKHILYTLFPIALDVLLEYSGIHFILCVTSLPDAKVYIPIQQPSLPDTGSRFRILTTRDNMVGPDAPKSRALVL